MAFLDKYRKLHPDGQESDEVEYNFGTMFHRMGGSLSFFLSLPSRLSLTTFPLLVARRSLLPRHLSLPQSSRPSREDEGSVEGGRESNALPPLVFLSRA